MGSVGAAWRVSANWLQETVTCHSPNCFSIVWGQGSAPLVTSQGCALVEPGGPWRLTFALR